MPLKSYLKWGLVGHYIGSLLGLQKPIYTANWNKIGVKIQWSLIDLDAVEAADSIVLEKILEQFLLSSNVIFKQTPRH